MFNKRIATWDLLAELPGHPFSESEREVRFAMDRYLRTSLLLPNLGWWARLVQPSQWLDVQAARGRTLLDLRAVLDRSEEHREAFRRVVAGLPAESPYRKVFAQLDA